MSFHLILEALGIKHSGGATVLGDFVSAAIEDDRFFRISVFCSPRTTRNFDFPRSEKLCVHECPRLERNRLLRLWWVRRQLSGEARRLAGDVVLCLGGIGSARPGPAQIAFIQQSLPFHPDALSVCGTRDRLRLRIIGEAMKHSNRECNVLIVQTPAMQRRVASQFGISQERIKVVLPDVADLPVPSFPSEQLARMRSVQPNLRLLYVGSQAAYKNVRFLLNCLPELRRAVPGLNLFLSCPPDHPACNTEGVVGLGYLHGPALREAYELATALVMPSLVETVGLPMLEAMNAGTPVMAADRPYAHDVCEDAAVFFDPLDERDFANEAATLLGNAARRAELAARGRDLIRRRRAEKPYERMLDVVADVAG